MRKRGPSCFEIRGHDSLPFVISVLVSVICVVRHALNIHKATVLKLIFYFAPNKKCLISDFIKSANLGILFTQVLNYFEMNSAKGCRSAFTKILHHLRQLNLMNLQTCHFWSQVHRCHHPLHHCFQNHLNQILPIRAIHLKFEELRVGQKPV